MEETEEASLVERFEEDKQLGHRRGEVGGVAIARGMEGAVRVGSAIRVPAQAFGREER